MSDTREQRIENILEAALLAAGTALRLDDLLKPFHDEDEPPDRSELRAGLVRLAESLSERGVELVEVASGFRLQVRSQFSRQVSALFVERPPRYSRALLETLALIAYRQPITRGEIEDVRGVSVSTNVIKTLQERNWIRVLGHREVPGRPALYGTTKEFLDYFSLNGLDQLPPLAELRDPDIPGGDLFAASEPAPELEAGQEQQHETDPAAEVEEQQELDASAELDGSDELEREPIETSQPDEDLAEVPQTETESTVEPLPDHEADQEDDDGAEHESDPEPSGQTDAEPDSEAEAGVRSFRQLADATALDEEPQEIESQEFESRELEPQESESAQSESEMDSTTLDSPDDMSPGDMSASDMSPGDMSPGDMSADNPPGERATASDEPR